MGTILFFGKTLCFLAGTFLIALETAIYDIGLGRNLKESHFNNNGIWTIPNGTTTELQEIFKMISEMPQPSPSFNDEVVWTPSEFGSSSLNMWIRLLFKTCQQFLGEVIFGSLVELISMLYVHGGHFTTASKLEISRIQEVLSLIYHAPCAIRVSRAASTFSTLVLSVIEFGNQFFQSLSS